MGSKVDVVTFRRYSMPTFDGSQTLEYLKTQFPHVKTIGVTGVDTSQLPETYRDGVEHLLPKPVTLPNLVSSIHSVLGVAVEAETKTARRKTKWIRFGLCYAILILCSYGVLWLLYQSWWRQGALLAVRFTDAASVFCGSSVRKSATPEHLPGTFHTTR